MKILMYKWNVFNEEDVGEAFANAGIEVGWIQESEESKIKEYPQEVAEIISQYDALFSLNYFTRLSNLCEKFHKKYISWTVDSPMLTLLNESVFNACNYIFIFDMFNYMQIKQLGVKNVYYLPLAVNVGRVQNVITNATDRLKECFQSDISFVGGLYHKNSYDKIYDDLPVYLKGYFDACIEAQTDVYGDYIFDKMLNADILEQLQEIVDFKQEKGAFSDIKTVFSSTFLGFKVAQQERIKILMELSDKFNMTFFSDQNDDRLRKVIHKGTVQYKEEMPLVFNQSKINLNISIKNIRTGLPLRIWDIMGAGGFLMTNYQAELSKYFENGKDIVFYESIDDLIKKCDYYLNHDDERKAVAESGFEKVRNYHSYDDRVSKIIEIWRKC